MAVETYADQLEPTNPDVVIWRFIGMDKFRDLNRTDFFLIFVFSALGPVRFVLILPLPERCKRYLWIAA